MTKKALFFAAAFLAVLQVAPVMSVSAQELDFALGNINIKKDMAEQEAIGTPAVLAAATDEPVAPETMPTPEPIMVKVKKGDSLSKIAAQHDTKWKRLYDANSFITDPNIINPGDKLRIPLADEVIAERKLPAAAPVVVRTRANASASRNTGVAAPKVVDGSVWDQLAQCESGGRWNINTGNGYYGGLQFNAGTWLSNGGGKYAPRADLASREQQIDIAQRLRAARGFSPWPACSRKLGLL